MGKRIESVTMEELFSSSTSGSFPILMDITHPDIVWAKNSTYKQKPGHLRLINAEYGVMYEGEEYLPAFFKFTLPSEDGKTIGNTSVTISAIDQSVIRVIRSISEKPRCSIVAFFAKRDSKIYFSKLCKYEFEMTNVQWDGVSATWQLVFDPVMQLNVPRDLATSLRCPAINVNENR